MVVLLNRSRFAICELLARFDEHSLLLTGEVLGQARRRIDLENLFLEFFGLSPHRHVILEIDGMQNSRCLHSFTKPSQQFRVSFITRA
jgi:hypothetical protein